MGQQQLLLLVLSAIIVGVSIVIGINMFASGAVQANEDAVVQDCLNIAARAQEWFRKPTAMGGGNRSFTDVELVKLNIKPTNENVSAPFTVVGLDSVVTIVGIGIEGSPLKVTIIAGPNAITSTTIEQ